MSTALEKRWYAAVASIERCVLCGTQGVEVSHSNALRGIGQKSEPWNTAALCRECHYEIDNGRHFPQDARRALHFRAIVLTHSALILSGRLALVTEKVAPRVGPYDRVYEEGVKWLDSL